MRHPACPAVEQGIESPSGKAFFQSSSVYGVLLNAFEGLWWGGFDCQMNVSMPASSVTPFLVDKLSSGGGRDSMSQA